MSKNSKNEKTELTVAVASTVAPIAQPEIAHVETPDVAAELALAKAALATAEQALQSLRAATGTRGQSGAKHALRELFTKQDFASDAQVFACGTGVAVRTALSDLKNPKYANGSLLILTRATQGAVAGYRNDTQAVLEARDAYAKAVARVAELSKGNASA